MPDESYIVEMVFETSNCYYEISKADLTTIMAEPDLQKRDKLISAAGKAVSVHSDDEVDLVVVVDSQPAVERWYDVQEQLDDLD